MDYKNFVVTDLAAGALLLRAQQRKIEDDFLAEITDKQVINGKIVGDGRIKGGFQSPISSQPKSPLHPSAIKSYSPNDNDKELNKQYDNEMKLKLWPNSKKNNKHLKLKLQYVKSSILSNSVLAKQNTNYKKFNDEDFRVNDIESNINEFDHKILSMLVEVNDYSGYMVNNIYIYKYICLLLKNFNYNS